MDNDTALNITQLVYNSNNTIHTKAHLNNNNNQQPAENDIDDDDDDVYWIFRWFAHFRFAHFSQQQQPHAIA